MSAQLELLDEQNEEEEQRKVRFERISDSAEPEGKGSFPSSSAACAAASTKVSLSESEGEEGALSATAEAYTVPQWDDNARVTELANTLTALTLAGVPVQDTSMKYVVISLRRIVTVTNSPAEATVDFSTVPRNPVRPRVSEVPTGTNESPTFDVMLQGAALSGQEPGMAVETLLLTIQSGTVTLVPAVVEFDIG